MNLDTQGSTATNSSNSSSSMVAVFVTQTISTLRLHYANNSNYRNKSPASPVVLVTTSPPYPIPSLLLYHWIYILMQTTGIAWSLPDLNLTWTWLSADERMRTNWLWRWPKHDFIMTKWQTIAWSLPDLNRTLSWWTHANKLTMMVTKTWLDHD